MSVIVKGGGGKSSGLYVWKKYSYVSSPTVTAQQTVADPSTFVLSSNDTDLTAYSFSDLIGLHLASDSSIKTYFEVIGDGTVKYYWNGSTYDFGSCTWDSSTKTLVVVGADYNGVNDNYTVSGLVGKKVLADYVVSDSPTAYPDGAVHTDGYWYEKFDSSTLTSENIRKGVDIWGVIGTLVEGKSGIDFGSLTIPDRYQSSVTVSHRLGKKPSWVALIAVDFVNATNYIAANINGCSVYNGGTGDGAFYSAANTLSSTSITFSAGSVYRFKQTEFYWFAIA